VFPLFPSLSSSFSLARPRARSRFCVRGHVFVCMCVCVCVYACACVCALHCVVSRLISPLSLPFSLSLFLSLTRLRVLSLFLCVCARACACALCSQPLRSMCVGSCVLRMRVCALTFSRALSLALVRSLVSFV